MRPLSNLGFDGFISKPIDVRQLNAVLNKFVRDRHPEQAKKYEPEIKCQTEAAETDPKVLKIFHGDAEKAVATLRETAANCDISLFTTTAHAMKSALANIGECEASGLASGLENAGLNRNMEYISANIDILIETLEGIICKIVIREADCQKSMDIEEDTACLTELLQTVKAACENYDDDAAYAALDLLNEKTWNAGTADALEQIRDALFIYSDFDGAAKMAEELTAPVL